MIVGVLLSQYVLWMFKALLWKRYHEVEYFVTDKTC